VHLVGFIIRIHFPILSLVHTADDLCQRARKEAEPLFQCFCLHVTQELYPNAFPTKMNYAKLDLPLP